MGCEPVLGKEEISCIEGGLYKGDIHKQHHRWAWAQHLVHDCTWGGGVTIMNWHRF